MESMKVRVTFQEDLLGTSPNDAEIFEKYIHSKAPDASTLQEEVEALGAEEVVRNGMTVFPRTDKGEPFIYDYQVKGFFKDACGMLSRIGGKAETGKKKTINESCKLTAYKKIIDGLIFVKPRKIVVNLSGAISKCQRPLRASTPQGERVSLACSESIPSGSFIEFEILCLDSAHWPAVTEWLHYGALRGMLQWRNSGKGAFIWEEISD